MTSRRGWPLVLLVIREQLRQHLLRLVRVVVMMLAGVLDDVTNLANQVQVVLDNGGGIVETVGNTSLSAIVAGSNSPTAGIPSLHA